MIEFCKLLIIQPCLYLNYSISPGLNTVHIQNHYIVGKWELVLFHVKPDEIGFASSKVSIERGESMSHSNLI